MSNVLNSLIIKYIFVKDLFGVYTYKIPLDSVQGNYEKLILLYGQNGCGKSTILNMLFYVLSTRDKSGYKSELAKIKFKKFLIVFENGVEIGVDRESYDIIGSYSFYIKENDKIIYKLELITDSENTINFVSKPEADIIYNNMLDFIRDLKVEVFYLDENRFIANSDDTTMEDKNMVNKYGLLNVHEEKNRKPIIFQYVNLDKRIIEFSKWIQNKALFAFRSGEKNSNSIYLDIIKRINQSSTTNKKQLNLNKKDKLIDILNDITLRSKEYSNLGFIIPYNTAGIVEILESSKGYKLSATIKILQPYMDVLDLRLKALENLKNILLKFINSINLYFVDKKILYKYPSGFTLIHDNKEKLKFNTLSSGEKQLLFLLINSIMATDSATIFIIDEPEISLNITWQRLLLNTLLDISKSSKVQFIIATHSIEILTNHNSSIAKLTNLN